jgi:branched-chain amino acid transport system substrate-binding protein
MQKFLRKTLTTFGAALLFAGAASAQIKVALIEPMSGPFANIGDMELKQFREIAEDTNGAGGLLNGQKLEIVPFDSKGSPQDALSSLQIAIDQGIRYVTQGSSSAVAGALIDAINKHNARNPDKSVLFLDFAAMDPDLTNSKCSFWHFRFLPNTDMKMEALTSYLAQDKAIKNVYIIGQDYAHGRQVAKAANAMIARKRPDIKIVGDELHPLGKVKDFSPYIAKIKASGADTVITGNLGNDLVLLVRAAKEASLNAKLYTYFAGLIGTPTAMGESGADHVYQVTEWHMNAMPNKYENFMLKFKKKYGIEPFSAQLNKQMQMFSKAIVDAKSTDPMKVAFALEGMRVAGSTEEYLMRKADHQLVEPLLVSVFTKAGGSDVKYDTENTGYGFKTKAVVPASQSDVPTTCVMTRPAM